MKNNEDTKKHDNTNRKKIKYPGFLFFSLLTVAYICVEFLFNATLIDNAGNDSANLLTVDSLEFFGRSVSAIGFVLVCLNLVKNGSIRILQIVTVLLTCALIFVILNSPVKHQIWLTIITTLGMLILTPTYIRRVTQAQFLKTVSIFCLFAWLLMFFGQKLIIDSYIIDNSTAAQRLLAQKMTLLKSGLANNIIKIKGLPDTSANIESPTEKAFLIMIGLLTMQSMNIVDKFEGQEEEIIKKIKYDLSHETFERSWKQYKTAQQELLRLYKTYENASIEYDTRRLNIQISAETAWLGILNRTRLNWYTFLQEKYFTLMQIEALQNLVSNTLVDLINKRNTCLQNSSSSCISKLDTEYTKLTQKTFKKPIKLNYWCRRSSNADICTTDKADVNSGIKMLLVSEFQDKGYPMDIKSYTEFFEHPTTATQIRSYIHNSYSIVLDETWKITNDKKFKTQFTQNLIPKLENEWNEKWKKSLGAFLPPKLDYINFQKSTTVANFLKRKPNAFKTLDFTYNKQQFYENEIEPKVEVEIQKTLVSLNEGHLLGNGMQRENLGKQYMRLVIIPPVAVSLSLLFALVNSVLLFFSVVDKWGVKKIILHYMKPVILFTYPVNKKLVYNVGSCLIVFVFIFSMKFSFSNEFSDSETFNYFVKQAREEGGIISAVSDWVIHVQPALYFVGDTLKSIFNTFWNTEYAYIIKGPLFIFDILFLIIDKLFVEILATSVAGGQT